ncbi:MAG: hypothetical protein ACLGHN_13050 [Bacteriovoracia bacterium]
MKTSLTKLSSSILLLTLSFSVWAKPVARVTNVIGTVFAVTDDGQTSVLKVNEHLPEKSEVMVEEGASITLNDFYDSTYHLVGGSHLKFFNKSVQLKKGKTWIQCLNARQPLALTTANGFVHFWKGEFIATFDHTNNRSQFLVVNGDVEVSNILDRNMKYTVPAGKFSMIDPEVENGLPRSPTNVGLQSLNSALAEFKKMPEEIQTTPERSIASVSETPVKKGKIIFITTHRKPASVQGGEALKYYKKIVNKKAHSQPIHVKIYGSSWKDKQSVQAPRHPASVQVVAPSNPKFTHSAPLNDHAFSESLKKHQVEQPKYSKELENLIDELKSY